MDASSFTAPDRAAAEKVVARVKTEFGPSLEQLRRENDELRETLGQETETRATLEMQLAEASRRAEEAERALNERPSNPDAIAEIAIGMLHDEFDQYFGARR